MERFKTYVNLGNNATFFGLGLLASKKMRPYAKYFIVGGLALSATPVIMQMVEQNKLKRIEFKEEQVDEVVVEDGAPCCPEEDKECTAECTEAAEADCQTEEPCDCGCADCADCAEPEEEAGDCPEEVPEA